MHRAGQGSIRPAGREGERLVYKIGNLRQIIRVAGVSIPDFSMAMNLAASAPFITR